MAERHSALPAFEKNGAPHGEPLRSCVVPRDEARELRRRLRHIQFDIEETRDKARSDIASSYAMMRAVDELIWPKGSSIGSKK
jgi:hypothetical protein